MAAFKPGDKVLVPWPPDEVRGTVLSLFGEGEEQYVRLELELPGDDDHPVFKALTLPVRWLHKAA